MVTNPQNFEHCGDFNVKDGCEIHSENDDITSPAPTDSTKYQEFKGWGSLVIVSVFFIYFLTDGCMFSFGLLFVEILGNFGESRTVSSVIPALLYGIPLLLSPFVCILVTLTSGRTVSVIGGCLFGLGYLLSSFAPKLEFLFLTLGIIAPIGLSMLYISAYLTVAFYFQQQRGLATGLAVCGSGIGSFVLSFLESFLLSSHGWSGAMLVTGALCLNTVPCGALLRPFRSVTTEKFAVCPSAEKLAFSKRFLRELRELLSTEILLSPGFWLIWFTYFFLFSVLGIPYVYLADNALQLALPSSDARILVGTVGLAGSAGQIVSGFVGDHGFVHPSVLFGFCLAVAAVMNFLMPCLTSMPTLLVYSVLYGAAIGANYSLQSSIVARVVGERLLAPAFGLLQLGQGVATLVGPPIAGELFRLTGDYGMTFVLAGAGFSLAAVCSLSVGLLAHWTQKPTAPQWATTDRQTDVQL